MEPILYNAAGSPVQSVINQALLWLLQQNSTNLRAFFRSTGLWTSAVWRTWPKVRAGKEQEHNVSILESITYIVWLICNIRIVELSRIQMACLCVQSLLPCRENLMLHDDKLARLLQVTCGKTLLRAGNLGYMFDFVTHNRNSLFLWSKRRATLVILSISFQ